MSNGVAIFMFIWLVVFKNGLRGSLEITVFENGIDIIWYIMSPKSSSMKPYYYTGFRIVFRL